MIDILPLEEYCWSLTQSVCRALWVGSAFSSSVERASLARILQLDAEEICSLNSGIFPHPESFWGQVLDCLYQDNPPTRFSSIATAGEEYTGYDTVGSVYRIFSSALIEEYNNNPHLYKEACHALKEVSDQSLVHLLDKTVRNGPYIPVSAGKPLDNLQEFVSELELRVAAHMKFYDNDVSLSQEKLKEKLTPIRSTVESNYFSSRSFEEFL